MEFVVEARTEVTCALDALPNPPACRHQTTDRKYTTTTTTPDGSRELLLSFNHITMSAPEIHHLFHNPIADHSFSPDRKTLAVARDNNVELYQNSANKFSLTDELKGHEKTVTGVDIAPNSGRIVTCSQGKTSSALAAASC